MKIRLYKLADEHWTTDPYDIKGRIYIDLYIYNNADDEDDFDDKELCLVARYLETGRTE